MARKNTVSQFLRGLATYLRVPGVLFRHGLWPYQLLPAVASLVLTVVMIAIFYFATAGFASWIDGLIVISIAWLDAAVTFTLTTLVVLLLVGGFIFLHKHIVLIVLAPFLGTIAEETLRAIQGKKYQLSELPLKDSIVRSVHINLKYVVREIATNLLFLLCGVIPVVGSILSATGMFATQSRFLGYGLMDFPLENQGLSAADSDRFVKSRNGLSMGVGAGYILLMGIPLVGWMFAPTFGTVAGTLVAMQELEEEGALSTAGPGTPAVTAAS